MVGRIYHVGLTVSDLDCSIAFYRDILGLKFQGEIFMEGEETDKMFRTSILCAFSGFGIWDKDGNKMWGRKKAAAK